MTTIACIGECMVEFSGGTHGAFTRGYGGDTLNTALYLARLGIDVAYVTALGDDPLSDQMIASWQSEGIDTGDVLRIPGRLPGLYLINRDPTGERSFLYWRDRAPAREFFQHVDATVLGRLSRSKWIYLSGITLSLYDHVDRMRLVKLLADVRNNGGSVAFDGNYRPAGWSSAGAARDAFASILPYVDLALPTFDDEQSLFGDSDAAACIKRLRAAGVSEIVVKLGYQGCVIHHGSEARSVEPERRIAPIDTTAAGDSFNAAYLAARIKGASPYEAAHAGHQLAGTVIQHAGAIIPRSAMPAIAESKALL